MTSQFGGVPVQEPDQYPVRKGGSQFGGMLVSDAGGASTDAASPQTSFKSLEQNFAAGAGEGVTGLVDLAGEVARSVPVVGQAIQATEGLTGKRLPGSHDVNLLLGEVNPALNPENTHANTTAEHIVRAMGTGATAALAPGPGEVTMGRAAVNAILGMVSGGTGEIAREAAPEKWKPEAQLAGGAVGAFSPMAVKGLIAPTVSPAVQKLLSEGVHLTPGQIASGMGILGKTAKTIEDAITSISYAGDIIRAAQRRGLESFQIAATNRALEPIGEKIPANIKAGRDSVKYAGDRLSAAYDHILPQLKIPIDDAFRKEVQDIRGSLSVLPKDIRDQFDGIVKDVVAGKFDVGTKMMDGQDFKKAEAELNRLQGKYSGHNATPDQQEMADHIGDLRAELHDLVERSNPTLAPKILAINTGYAVLTRIERAAGSTGAVDGLFTAPQLQGAVKAMDRSSRKRAFARGQALLQDLSDAGRSVLPSSVPDSGTATRGIMAATLAGGAGLAAHLNPYTLGAAAGTAALYTPAGTKAAEYALAHRPYDIQSASQLFDQYGGSVPAAITAGGIEPYLRQSQQ